MKKLMFILFLFTINVDVFAGFSGGGRSFGGGFRPSTIRSTPSTYRSIKTNTGSHGYILTTILLVHMLTNNSASASTVVKTAQENELLFLKSVIHTTKDKCELNTENDDYKVVYKSPKKLCYTFKTVE